MRLGRTESLISGGVIGLIAWAWLDSLAGAVVIGAFVVLLVLIHEAISDLQGEVSRLATHGI